MPKAIVPTKELTVDPHTAALFRLAAVTQYLYDTTGGDNFSSEQFHRSPLPEMATEKVREAQRLLHEAVKDGQRVRRVCIGGELTLTENWKPEFASQNPGGGE